MTSLDLFRLDGQCAVVTGGAGGLGAAIARGLAEAGAAVCVADENAGQGTLIAEALSRAGHRALALEVDVTAPDAVERMAADVEARLGPIDVLVNSAGITHRSPAADFPEAEWHRVIAVNLTGLFAPSWFESNIGDLIHREPGYEERSMRRVPFGRMGKPDELVGAALYLASEASSMVTGHILAVDGGTLAS